MVRSRRALPARPESMWLRLVPRFRREAPPFAEVVSRSDASAPSIELVRSAALPASLEAIVERFFDARGRLRRSPNASLSALEKALASSGSELRIGDDARA